VAGSVPSTLCSAAAFARLGLAFFFGAFSAITGSLGAGDAKPRVRTCVIGRHEPPLRIRCANRPR
jgi:hypothetical protein